MRYCLKMTKRERERKLFILLWDRVPCITKTSNLYDDLYDFCLHFFFYFFLFFSCFDETHLPSNILQLPPSHSCRHLTIHHPLSSDKKNNTKKHVEAYQRLEKMLAGTFFTIF